MSASMRAGHPGWLHWKNFLPEGSLGLPAQRALMHGPCDVAYLLASDADVLDVDTRQQGLNSVERRHHAQEVWIPRHGLPAGQDLKQDPAHYG